jgi:RND family efflux transporter MFP subunit
MTKKKYGGRALCILIATVFVFGCSKGKDPAKDPANRPPVAVEVVKATAADIVQGIDVVGSLSAKYQADVRAEFAGAVTDVYVTEWIRVQKGTPLARQDTKELDAALRALDASVEGAKANVLQAEVAKNRSEREYERFLKMKEAGLVTQQNVDDITTERDAAVARLSAAKAALRASEQQLKQGTAHISKGLIRSPMNGIVAMRNVNPGDLVGDMGGTKVLFRVVDLHFLDLTVTVPSTEMAAIRVGQPVTFSTDVWPGKTFSGKVAFVNPVVSEADRSVKIVVEVRNDSEELKPGLFVKGKIITGNRKGVLQVPRTGLLSWDMVKKQADVFVLNGDKVQRKTVQTGAVSTDLVEVVSGLTADDWIVTRGGFNLKDEDRVKVVQGSGR